MRRTLGLGLLAALAVLGLNDCGGVEKDAKARPLPEDRKALQPGEYRSEEFEPSLFFEVGKGWTNKPPEASDTLQILREKNDGVVVFLNVREVYEPTPTGTPSVLDAPEDMAGWLRHHPYLKTSKPEPVTVGGAEGVHFDVVLGDLPGGHFGACRLVVPVDCVDLFRLSTGQLMFQDEGQKVRSIVFEDAKGETVEIVIASPATEFDEFLPQAQKVVDSVKWKGS